MTVIAYSSKHRIMAADSRFADPEGGTHFTSGQKIYRLKSGTLLGLAGDADSRDVCALFEKASPRKFPTRAQIAELKADFEGLVVFPKGQIFNVTGEFLERGRGEWSGEVIAVRDAIAAVGSGATLAYGALEHGASPIEAVRIACRRDLYCALPVQWEKLP